MMAGVKREIAQMSDYKLFNDSVHGHMKFHPLIVRIINTPQFQRLRDLKQLGLAYYLYPSASHNRFEHSLGTCYLAGLLMDTLYKHEPFPKNEEEQFEREKDKLCVEIAGLCHDLGHGPFSHFWEQFLKKAEDQKWKHEENSIGMLDLILEEPVTKRDVKKPRIDGEGATTSRTVTIRELFYDYGLGENEINFIKNLIMGRKADPNSSEEEKKKHYLYQVVNNADNDIDVDKLDYLSRDSKMLNVNIHFQPHRIINLCRIANADGIRQICFRGKVCTDIADMFMARAVLHDKAYNHLKVKVMTEMALDAFYYAEPSLSHVFGKPITITDPNYMGQITDSLFHIALHLNPTNYRESAHNLEKGKKILNRLLKREYYHIMFLDVIEHENPIPENTKEKLPLDILIKLRDKNRVVFKELTDKEIGIAFIEISGSGSNKTNPLDRVYVYERDDPDTAKKYDSTKSACLSLMPTLNEYLKRKVLVLYKGEDQTISDNFKAEEGTIRKVLETVLQDNSILPK